MKDILISLAVNGRDAYEDRVKGLEQSLVHWHGDVRIYKEFPEWCTPHSEIPYAFKYDLIKKAIDEGYKRIVWADSSMRLLKNPITLLDRSCGVVAFHNLGHDLINYINDTAIKNLETSVEDIEGVQQTWGGCLMFDFSKDLTRTVFKELQTQISLGSFHDDKTERPGFKAHRHDQAVLSYILHKHKIPLLPYGIIAAKEHITDETIIQYAD